MTEYPNGVMQNHAPPYAPFELKPVGEQNWKMFATKADAEIGLQMIQSVCPDAQMQDATEGMYSQFIYFEQNPDIKARIVYGTVQQDGQSLAIQEYPSSIFDRYQKPQPFIDQYSEGQPHTLKARAVTPEIAELYWSA